MNYFFAGIFPERGVQAIQRIRRKYDPTVTVVDPHITVLFPVPETVGEAELLSHLGEVCARRSSFEIELGGFHRSDDHWLFLTLLKGAEDVRSLYLEVYSGILREYRRDDIPFVPHIGLGLFVRGDGSYEMGNPDSARFDDAAYGAALAEASALEFDSAELAGALRVMKVPASVMEWASGRRPRIPAEARAENVRTIGFGANT
jgi:2'-5' RNA ligase